MTGARFAGTELTLHQICRLASCARAQERLCRPFFIADVMPEFDAEEALVGRFLREMVARGYLQESPRPPEFWRRRSKFYVVTTRWYIVSDGLRVAGCLPGVCCACGADSAVSFPFLRRFFCRDCLMEAHRDDYKCATACDETEPARQK